MISTSCLNFDWSALFCLKQQEEMLEGEVNGERGGGGGTEGLGGGKTLKRHVSILAGQREWVCHKHASGQLRG